MNCQILLVWLSYREYILLSYYNAKMLKMWSKPCVKMHFWPVPMKTFREIFGLMDTLTTELLNTGAAGCFFRTHLHSQKFQIFRFHSDFSASHFFAKIAFLSCSVGIRTTTDKHFLSSQSRNNVLRLR